MKGSPAMNAYAGYSLDVPDVEDAEITHTGRGTAAGELFRRYWQPIAMSEEVTSFPKAIRIMSEDLVVFRAMDGSVGCLHAKCSHRGTSLEFGIVTQSGIRCCYHGWQYAVDGTIVETPGEPPHSRIKEIACQGAYPVHEFAGLVFAYLGPPDRRPPFPVFDSYAMPDDRLVPFSIDMDCNWLQTFENHMDPVHTVFLHTRISEIQFADAFGALPHLDFVETPLGMMYVATRRHKEHVWVRTVETIFPNLGQVSAVWEDAEREKLFTRVGITRWTVPVDDRRHIFIGWRHFHPSTDLNGVGRESDVGRNKMDFAGQVAGRTLREAQIEPGDYEAQCAQGPIAVHAAEHLGWTDRGITKLRRTLRDGMRALAGGVEPPPMARSAEPVPTFTQDTVLRIPVRADRDDREVLADVSRRVVAVLLAHNAVAFPERDERIAAELREIPGAFAGAVPV